MPKNSSLRKAAKVKNDEFYTQYADIQREVNAYLEYNPDVFRNKTILLPCDDPEWSNFTLFFAQNFKNFGLKKLISTSYAVESKQLEIDYQPTNFEKYSSNFDETKTRCRGKIFTLDKDINGDGKVDFKDLKWQSLEDDGDFNSDEGKKLRDEADIIITNPPFSLFREFLKWIMEAKKQFLILGNMNAITYKEIFPYLKDNIIWLGVVNGAKEYITPTGEHKKMGNTCWFTNIDHGRRHTPLSLMSMEDNIKYSKHKEIKEKGYQKYDFYDAIEVPYTDAIPNDYNDLMGVPNSFLNKYCPEQFQIIDAIGRYSQLYGATEETQGKYLTMVNGIHKFVRIVIKRK